MPGDDEDAPLRKNLITNRKKIKNIHRIKEHWKTKRLKTLTKEQQYEIGNQYLKEIQVLNAKKKKSTNKKSKKRKLSDKEVNTVVKLLQEGQIIEGSKKKAEKPRKKHKDYLIELRKKKLIANQTNKSYIDDQIKRYGNEIDYFSLVDNIECKTQRELDKIKVKRVLGKTPQEELRTKESELLADSIRSKLGIL